MFDEPIFPAQSQIESGSDNDNNAKSFSIYDSSRRKVLEFSVVEVDILDYRGDKNNKDSSKLRDVNQRSAISDLLSGQKPDFHPDICTKTSHTHTKPRRYGNKISEALNFDMITSDTPTFDDAMNCTTQNIEFW